MTQHRFSKVLFAVEHAGTACGVGLKANELEKLLVHAASLSPGGALELFPLPNQALFEQAMQPGGCDQGQPVAKGEEMASELLRAILALPEAQDCLHKLRSGQGTKTDSAVWLRAESFVGALQNIT